MIIVIVLLVFVILLMQFVRYVGKDHQDAEQIANERMERYKEKYGER